MFWWLQPNFPIRNLLCGKVQTRGGCYSEAARRVYPKVNPRVRSKLFFCALRRGGGLEKKKGLNQFTQSATFSCFMSPYMHIVLLRASHQTLRAGWFILLLLAGRVPE